MIFSLVIGIGLARWAASERGGAVAVFSILYVGAIFFWAWSGPRLLYPVLPSLYFALLLGVEALSPKRLRPAALGLAVAVLLVASAYKVAVIDDNRLHTGDLQARTAWLRANTDPSESVVAEARQVNFLYGGRATVSYPLPPLSATELDNYLTSSGAAYLLVAPEIKWQAACAPTYSSLTSALLPQISQLGVEGRLQLVHRSQPDLIMIYRIAR